MGLASRGRVAIRRMVVPNCRKDLPNCDWEPKRRYDGWGRTAPEPTYRATDSNDRAPDANPSHSHSIP